MEAASAVRSASPQTHAAPELEDLPEIAVRCSDATLTVVPGAWQPPRPDDFAPHAFACVVLEGLMLREVHLGGAPATQLVGPGAVIDPWSSDGHSVLCGERVSWSALEPARLAVLGTRFVSATRRWPRLTVLLHARFAAQVHAAARYAAIAQLPRVEDRVLALFCVMGDDLGQVRPDGIGIDVRLTHEAIGRLVGARRPTISLALGTLADQALLRRSDRGWVLSQEATRLVAQHADQPGPDPGYTVVEGA